MLKQRVVTAAVALIVVVAAIFISPWTWCVLVLAGTLMGMAELAAMVKQRRFGLGTLWGYLLVAAWVLAPQWAPSFLVPWGVLITLTIPVLTRNRVPFAAAAPLTVGAVYIGMGGWSLVSLRGLDDGIAWLFITMVSIWTTDTAAFFVGQRLQGPKLWPEISPNKTISGAVAGVVAGGIAAVVLGSLTVGRLGVGWFFSFGALVSIAGQLGDLAESAYKRSAGVKDSGHLLPGHGGVLDRVDSVLFAGPVALYFILHLST
ncbi:phosphatidate cytidylyltransferase [Alicyclobacillus contaminans]|uniref:phosphatidate cytidylyltransferase n=1 Tax=Alicyclobacillus contaminans TaxID=392016 RepID=UPI0003FC2723|nr:phosphatidate cytidylyltransferase [Alicyclobacillus contaminans]GMA49006.1 phosphatidate cytidylyltransferase [Alicyclobacillus contaminans]